MLTKIIPNISSGLVKKADYNTKITEIENKIPSVTGSVTIAMLNTNATEIEKNYLILLICNIINQIKYLERDGEIQ